MVIAACGTTVAAALLVSDPANRLGYVQALAWPTVAVIAWFSVRKALPGLVARIIRLAFGGLSIELEQHNNQELEDNLREHVPVLVDRESPSTAGTPAQRSAAVEDAEQARRRAIEQALADGALWGYRMSQVYTSPPRPVVIWNDDGEPFIEGASVTRRSPHPFSKVAAKLAGLDPAEPSTTAARAERDVRGLERELAETRYSAAGGPLSTLALQEQLKTARQRLQRADPESPLLL